MEKSRVAPIKNITTPRMELVSAPLSFKISALLQKELQLLNVKKTFWTDSEVVIRYIRNESRKFKVFVANRIEMIRDPQLYINGTILVPRIIQQIIVLEVLMWQITKLFKIGFEDYLFCGNQKQSGPFKITKEGFYRMIQK